MAIVDNVKNFLLSSSSVMQKNWCFSYRAVMCKRSKIGEEGRQGIPLRTGVISGPLETRLPSLDITVPNLVTLGQTV